MALLAVSSNLARIAAAPAKNLCCAQLPLRVINAGISGKVLREARPKPAPFPYREKDYTLLRTFFDKTTDRFDENSKIICVEGPIACGKTEFAKTLAEDLDMLHIPEANMDLRYINSYGYDMRKLDPQLPPNIRSFDEKDFCRNPKHFNVASFQVWMYRLRYSLYIDALAHVLSTGQGVVIERSPWSDMVFVEAMKSQGYISKEARQAYYEIKDNTIDQLMKPHLIIYLDMSVDKVLEKIKMRGRGYEVNSKALTRPYLEALQLNYKSKYLKAISEHAELLMYNWAEGGDMEVVVEDIERIDFDQYGKHEKRLSDWYKPKEQAWADTRMLYADDKEALMALFNVPITYCPELSLTGEEMKIFNEVWFGVPGMEYEKGFNQYQGDTNILFKTKSEKYVPY